MHIAPLHGGAVMYILVMANIYIAFAMKINNLWRNNMKVNQAIDNIFNKLINAMRDQAKNGTHWTCSWDKSRVGIPYSMAKNGSYEGINVPLLMMAQSEHDYTSSKWGTWKYWESKGREIKEDETKKYEHTVYWKFFDKTDDNGDVVGTIPFVRYSRVYNECQLKDYEEPVMEEKSDFDTIKEVETFFDNTGADVRYGGDRAFYSPSLDYIQMPKAINFNDTDDATAQQNYYGVQGHELVHWTGAKTRLDRVGVNRADETSNSFRQTYAYEELIAECGSALLCLELGISAEPNPNHASYLNSWLKALDNDTTILMSAFTKAQKSVNYLKELQKQDTKVA